MGNSKYFLASEVLLSFFFSVVGCCGPSRGDLLPCCSIVLVEKAGAVPGASL